MIIFTMYKKTFLVILIITLFSICTNESFSQIISEQDKTSNFYIAIEEKARENQENSEYSKALEYYLLLAKVSKQNNQQEFYVRSLIGLSKVFHNVDKVEYSYVYSKECINESKKINNKIYLAHSYNSYANCINDMGDKDSAIFYYNEAKTIYEQIGHKEGIAGINNNLANYNLSIGNYEIALDNYKKSLDIAIELGLSNDECLYNINIGEVYFRQNDFKSAIAYTNRSIFIAKETNNLLFLSRGYAQLYRINKELGSYKTSLDFLEKSIEINEGIFNQSLEQNIAKIKFEADLKKKAAEVEILEKQQEINSYRIRNQLITIFSLILFLSSLALVLINIIKRKKEKEEKYKTKLQSNKISLQLKEKENELLSEKTKSKSRELASVTIINSNKNDLLISIQELLAKYEDKKEKMILKTIKNHISENIRTEEDWELFKLHFETVNPDFFAILKTEHSSLTQNNLKLCAYIKIGLTNKEIARLLNVSPDSIKTAKKRLKKKIGIPPGDDFTF